jgi:hypothetical protein
MSENPFHRNSIQSCLEARAARMDFPAPAPLAAGPDFQSYIAPSPRTLEQAAKTATDRVDVRALKLLEGRGNSVPLTKALLGQLILCYSRQIYASTDISDVVRRDRTFFRLCGEDSLGARDISTFRSNNRQVIHRCLIAALQFLTTQKISLGVLTRVSHAQLAEEASRRIIMAGFIDSMELDGATMMDPPAEFSYLSANRNDESLQ